MELKVSFKLTSLLDWVVLSNWIKTPLLFTNLEVISQTIFSISTLLRSVGLQYFKHLHLHQHVNKFSHINTGIMASTQNSWSVIWKLYLINSPASTINGFYPKLINSPASTINGFDPELPKHKLHTFSFSLYY